LSNPFFEKVPDPPKSGGTHGGSVALIVYTVGHSTRSLDAFLDLLRENGVERLVDVRQYPGSRRFPHFGREPLRAALEAAGIDYLHAPGLGGRRRGRPDSANTAWRNAGFRAYADYMETGEFRAAVEDLLRAAEEKPTTVMCAEALWWRCHRALISDYLKSIGVEVVHIGDAGSEPHPYTSAARLVEGRLTYTEDELPGIDDAGRG
jgi:uncharacterized protein (DUF488 family)